MQFGKVEDPSKIDFSLPADAKETPEVLSKTKANNSFDAYVGCPR